MEVKSLGYFLAMYEKFTIAENKSPRTIEAVRDATKKFEEFLGGCANLNDLQPEDLRRYIRYLQQRPKWSGHPTIKGTHGNVSPAAIASYVRSIRSLFSWMAKEKFISQNPFAEVKPPKVPAKVINPLTPDEVSRLLKAISHRDYGSRRDSSMVIALYGTAQRLSELLGLKLSDIDFDSGQIKVTGKGSKERHLYMSSRVFKALFKYRSQWRPEVSSDYFFVHLDGSRLSRYYFEHRMQDYVRRAGLTTRCTPHSLRYASAVQLIRNGCDPLTLQKILGHSTLDMTRHYVRLANTDVEKKMKAFSPAEQLDLKF